MTETHGNCGATTGVKQLPGTLWPNAVMHVEPRGVTNFHLSWLGLKTSEWPRDSDWVRFELQHGEPPSTLFRLKASSQLVVAPYERVISRRTVTWLQVPVVDVTN